MLIISQFVFGSARMESLGEYFSFIVGDTDTDIELFPTHLNEYKGKHVRFGSSANTRDKYTSTGNLNIAVLPLLNRFSYKLILEAYGNENNNIFQKHYQDGYINPRYYFNPFKTSKYNSMYTDGLESAAMKNLFSFKFSENFSVGSIISISKEINDSYREAETENTDTDRLYTSVHNINLDDFSTLVNFHFKNFFLNDVSFSYQSLDNIEEESTIRTDNNIYSWGDSRFSEDQALVDSDENGVIYSLAMLHENKEDAIIKRIFTEISYSEFDLSYTSSEFRMQEHYQNDEYEYMDLQQELNSADYNNALYKGCVGLGFENPKKDLTLFYGLKIGGFLGEFTGNESFSALDFHEHIYPDSTVTDSVSTQYEHRKDGKEYRASVELPIGAKFKITEKINISGGLGYKVTRLYLQNANEDNYYRWHTEVYQTLGAELNPIDKLKINLMFNSDLASLKYWIIDVKYFF